VIQVGAISPCSFATASAEVIGRGVSTMENFPGCECLSEAVAGRCAVAWLKVKQPNYREGGGGWEPKAAGQSVARGPPSWIRRRAAAPTRTAARDAGGSERGGWLCFSPSSRCRSGSELQRPLVARCRSQSVSSPTGPTRRRSDHRTSPSTDTCTGRAAVCSRGRASG
jgi:hypothetical protein